ncbi:thioredoxin family protein [Salipaludibacillus sp. CUR1]|uniref:Thioredoxin domain-containing protein n=1 Tax=Salipaludibacillus aurantiacus TaxID=1601833 RepID=A0A1H9T7I7_9BACI|nr:thioredoxin family protein [Salipaludibacillus aurantiacus]MCE7793529.1 thioredoxin family protein [Salipaludibacillus sp. CUR1]SER93108.1 Thioredoxin domain-containing protein [Salipaludibacillus aurantiacus]
MEIKICITSNINGKVFEKRVTEVISELGIKADILTVHDLPRSPEKVFYTPALFINDRMLSSGKVLSKEEITQFFM